MKMNQHDFTKAKMTTFRTGQTPGGTNFELAESKFSYHGIKACAERDETELKH